MDTLKLNTMLKSYMWMVIVYKDQILNLKQVLCCLCKSNYRYIRHLILWWVWHGYMLNC